EAKGGMYFNKRLLEEAGIDPQDIYDYQENMEWTWDKFEEICQKVAADTDNDGVIDRYAMANFTSEFYPMAVYSNGGQFIGRDENGNLYNDLESDATIEALNWALDMLGKYEMTYPEDANWDYWITAYQNGEACFMASEAYRAGQLEEAGMNDDFGFVCFPMGPRMDDYTNCWMNNPVVIPACYDEEKAWKLAFAYNLYTEVVPGYPEDAAFKSNYYKSFRDTESVDLTIARLEENGFLTYHGMVPGLDLGPDLFWAINKDNTPAQQAETIRPVWAAYLEEVN
ncbi:MAG: extracellular solute-binding protein, partial [Acetatifactor sp.]|nr:extracellular solute-binding protein [Acetatifactor sp.]